MSLSPQEVWYFRHNGFIIPSTRVPDELLDRANAQTDHEVAEQLEPIVWATDARDPTRRVLNRLSKLLLRAPVYYEVATHPAVLDPLEAILGPHIELLTNKHNHLMVRPPGSPPVSWHYGEPYSQPRLITAIVPLGDTTIENGCTRFVPGSHVNPLEPDPHRTDVARMRRVNELQFQETELYRLSVPVPLEARPGHPLRQLHLARLGPQRHRPGPAQHDAGLRGARAARHAQGRSREAAGARPAGVLRARSARPRVALAGRPSRKRRRSRPDAKVPR